MSSQKSAPKKSKSTGKDGLRKMSRDDRMRLMKFVCSFAWSDLEVHDKERALIRKLASTLDLVQDEVDDVERWLVVPPRPEEVDPATIPVRHREIFLDAARQVIVVDGRIDPEEKESFDLLQQLIR